jgi:hypothetical protein
MEEEEEEGEEEVVCSQVWGIAKQKRFEPRNLPGVPIVKAPFKQPIMKATPPDHPVEFSKSTNTEEVLA